MFVILFEIYFLLVFFENSQRFSNLQKEIHILKTACNEVQDNKKLVCFYRFNWHFSSKYQISLLELVLALGNYINGSTFRGGAFGFKLTSLQKMLEVKQNNGKGTLMHYLVDLLEAGDKKRQELLSFMEDVSCLCLIYFWRHNEAHLNPLHL